MTLQGVRVKGRNAPPHRERGLPSHSAPPTLKSHLLLFLSLLERKSRGGEEGLGMPKLRDEHKDAAAITSEGLGSE